MRTRSPSRQLKHDLDEATRRSLANRRPILHHLNADTSWLLQIPSPQISRSHRAYFNILIDPWFKGPQSDIANWFSQQWHAQKSAVTSIAEVEELIYGIEDLCSCSTEIKEELGTSAIDAIAISHEFTDHCHKDTLLEAQPNIPVLASPAAAKLIMSWNHFRTVHATPVLSGRGFNWRRIAIPPLPDWIGIARLQKEDDFVYLHSALLVAFNAESIGRGGMAGMKGRFDPTTPAECLIYSPHGIDPAVLLPIAAASPPLQPLAFCHGLHDVRLSKLQQLNLGAHNGLASQRILKAKYWLATHDEVKVGGGIVKWILRRKMISVEDAMEEEARELGADGTDDDMELALGNPNFRMVGNGESIVLE